MNKKIISATLAVLMMSSVAAVAASADEVAVEPAGAAATFVKTGDATGKIRFDMGNWNHEDTLAFYIWAEKEGEKAQHCVAGEWQEDAKWGSKKNKGTPVEGEDGIVESFEFSIPDGWNTFVIFHDLTTDNQTTDCVITPSAFNDGVVARMNGEYVENPVDSDKSALDVVFDGASDCGSHRMVTSTGNISGSVPAPNDNPARLVANYIAKQLGVVDKNGEECVTKDKVANALSVFGTDKDSVMAELPNSEDYKADQEAKYKEMLGIEDKKEETPSDTGSGNNTSSTNSTGGSTTGGSTTAGTASKAATTTAAGTTTTSAPADTGAAAATGDTTGTAAFAVVLLAAAATMFLARKKVED